MNSLQAKVNKAEWCMGKGLQVVVLQPSAQKEGLIGEGAGGGFLDRGLRVEVGVCPIFCWCVYCDICRLWLCCFLREIAKSLSRLLTESSVRREIWGRLAQLQTYSRFTSALLSHRDQNVLVCEGAYSGSLYWQEFPTLTTESCRVGWGPQPCSWKAC